MNTPVTSESPLLYTLHLQSAPYHRQSCRSALRFAEALLNKGHRLKLVFFSSEAVVIANRFAELPQDEESMAQAWTTLAAQYQFSLAICSAAAARRGVVSKLKVSKTLAKGSSEAPADVEVYGEEGCGEHRGKHREEVGSLLKGFHIAGLGEFVEASVVSDRVISFG